MSSNSKIKLTNLEEYKEVFKTSFDVKEEELDNLKYQDIEMWDSVGHMSLMSALEEKFNIELDIDDIIDFSSFKKGIEILNKYQIKI